MGTIYGAYQIGYTIQVSQQSFYVPSRFYQEEYGVNSIEEYVTEKQIPYEILSSKLLSGTSIMSSFVEVVEKVAETFYKRTIYSATALQDLPIISSIGTSQLNSFTPPILSWGMVVTTLPILMITIINFLPFGKEKHKKTRITIIFMLVLITVALISFQVGITLAAPTTTTLEEGSLVETASYVVWVDGTTYYAKNGRTGAIDFSGTDASTVIQAAIDAITSGLIFFKTGTYLCGSAIVINKPYIDFEGAGRTTIIKASEIMTRLLDMRSSANNYIKNILLEGDNKVTTLVDLSHSDQTYMASIFEKVYAQRGTTGFEIDKTDTIDWYDCWISDVTTAILIPTTAAGGFRIFGGSITGTTSLDVGTYSNWYLQGAYIANIAIRDNTRITIKNGYTEGAQPYNFRGISAPNSRLMIDGGFYRTITSTKMNIDSTGTGLGLVSLRNAQFYAPADATYNFQFTGKLIIDDSVTYDRLIDWTNLTGSTKEFSVPATGGTEFYDVYRTPTYCINADDEYADIFFRVPDDFHGLSSAKVIWIAFAAVTDMNFRLVTGWEASGETSYTHTDTVDVTRTTLANYFYENDISAAYTGITVGDIIGTKVNRVAGMTTNAGIVGIKFTYY